MRFMLAWKSMSTWPEKTWERAIFQRKMSDPCIIGVKIPFDAFIILYFSATLCLPQAVKLCTYFFFRHPYYYRNFYTTGNSQEVFTMQEISVLDLQNLRHLIGGYETTHCKMENYAQEATDPQIKQFFQKAAQSAAQNKQQLLQFL